ncbi:hypothetical protein MPF83_02335 [Helicobacter pylori]|uniref:hypothetical protein n=1 Tax=Helicobacter pylori TaxID=210 RepID=UPI001FD5AB81|nr:hypothetical protein [Helicobacter pylori]UOR49291.1 hypothetical protein MPF83_00590 [Helicobacter pylori]UOR49596.1 hypothetical protein MPF83_02335 [Helicobacter pylori]
MGFQNENQSKVGALVKATINNKVVEAKVISIGFNRVTLRSEKGNEVSYAFNSEKFLKWFNHTPLSEVAKNPAESGKKDILEGLKIVTSGLSVKERTTTPKEKEDKYKLAFGFNREGISSSEIMIESYTLAERKSRLGVLLSPMFYEGKGNQITAIIITALAHAKDLNKHSDAEWLALIENRNTEGCYYNTLDYMDRVETTLFCDVIRKYARRLDKELEAELNDFSPSGFWARTLPKNKNEAMFIAQLLCDDGINKYDLSCAGLTENLLKDIYPVFGLASVSEVDEYLDNLDRMSILIFY